MRILSLLLSTVVTCLVVAVAPASARSEAPDYPVPYNFVPYAVIGGANENPPGANDWSCTPSRKHPRPVVLVHGLMGNKSTNWQTYAPLLANEGYCVFSLTYGEKTVPTQGAFGGLTAMQDSARELKRFVAKVRNATGAAEVDLVGHSEGTLMPNYYVKFLGGAQFVKRYVSIAPLWHGTQAAVLASVVAATGQDSEQSTPVCTACAQFAPDSRFMKKMRRGGVAVPGVEYTNIVTEYDQLVIPYTSGIQKGMRNIVLQDGCEQDLSEHFQIVADRRASVMVLNELQPGLDRKVPCEPVGPFVGGAPGNP
jgi:triacylglycerol lipase